MTGNILLTIRKMIQDSTTSFLVGSHRVSAHDRQDFAVIVNGLALWVNLLLDQCDRSSIPGVSETCRGRIMKIRLPRVAGESKVVDLTALLAYLDCCNDILLKEMSTDEPFKAARVRKYIQNETTIELRWAFTCIMQVMTVLTDGALRGEVSETTMARELRQTFSFLKKLQIGRPDLQEALFKERLEFENHLSQVVVPSLQLPYAQEVIKSMNLLARKVLADLPIVVLAPQHGPGAVADPNVKCWFDKNLTMRSDARIAYLLRSRGLGHETDYCPWVLNEPSDRQSRFCGVPKTWKKLRGIAAEPVELQYYQQAVLRILDDYFRDHPWWCSRVDMHNQERSQELARLGSITGSYATIDLSAASDSVTLELVKQVFKGTPILPWLLGTRSTSCRVGDVSIKLDMFASMGSACCFPVECMIFALAAQVASDRTRTCLDPKVETVCVFGDDIIVEWYAADETVAVLQSLGFSVNTEKSYWTGRFREACGAECYSGVDIRPVRYSSLVALPHDRPLDAQRYAQSIALINALFWRGYRTTRKAYLECLLASKIKLGESTFPTKATLPFSFSGERGTIASFIPTNFNGKFRFSLNKSNKKGSNYQRVEHEVVTWKMKPLRPITQSKKIELFTHMQYVSWQIRHQTGLRDWDKVWEDGYLTDVDYSGWANAHAEEPIFSWTRLPLGMTMKPTRKWAYWEIVDTLG